MAIKGDGSFEPGNMTQPNYKDRVRAERHELADKLQKLDKAMSDHPEYDTDGLLAQQALHMREYLNVLDLRIAGF